MQSQSGVLRVGFKVEEEAIPPSQSCFVILLGSHINTKESYEGFIYSEAKLNLNFRGQFLNT
jgi:hypothetical protein